MCGIVGAVSGRDVVPLLVEGLQRLEYRGYDSAGIAVVNGSLQRVRSVGRVSEMQVKATGSSIHGLIGIGHTRWATHGGVTEANAHPQISNAEIAVVHNGIIENHEQLRNRLMELGYIFESQTDTEVIAHLIHHHLKEQGNLFSAVRAATHELVGAYAIGVVYANTPDTMICARMGCPLLIGLGDGENFVASDVSAILSVTRRVIYLEDGDVAEVHGRQVAIADRNDVSVQRKVHVSDVSLEAIQLGTYQHYMQKEIHEQPHAIAETLKHVFETGFNPEVFGEDASLDFKAIDSVLILAAGTSYYAGLTAKYWIEDIARIPVAVEIASEYRYRMSVPSPRQLVITISQSGETLDTLEALKHAKLLGQDRTLSICNVPESAIPRSSKLHFYTRAGPEIGVASTKAFTTQLVTLFVFGVTLAKLRGQLTSAKEAMFLETLQQLPESMQHALNLEPQIRAWAKAFDGRQHALFLGRGMHYPIALEGALKLKEISYIHAEAYPAGELKHGPLALVDQDMPVVVIAPNDSLLEKVKSNMQEVRARGGELFVFTDQDSDFSAGDGVHLIRIPGRMGVLSPIMHAVPVQLLAYHAALRRGTDVDKPRNLAKSVTVE
ncbi:MAG: glutamine--fructose-6-phosphate transaminase (isomerizing) [Gammaproteobacteria bacterium]